MNNSTFGNLVYDANLIVIIDVHGKILYYEDYNDNINMLKKENVIGRYIYELYPYFKREEFTVFRAIDTKKPILNEYQYFKVNGIEKGALNSAFPLINETGVIGGIVISVELPRTSTTKNNNKLMAKYSFIDIITKNKQFLESLDILNRVSINDTNILINGETGTGKELIAHSIHNSSRRRRKPFIIQNCAAIPSSLMESMFFGTKAGSFTGAVDKEGIFEAAKGGTIFLDEINSMQLDLQSKVLRAIESKSIKRIGENIEREIDVRIIASTNEDLLENVKQGKFRADLYYRLNVFSFNIPPLRERVDDITLLTEYYIERFNQMFNKKITGISDEVKAIFKSHSWEGNVRELKNVIEYSMNLIEKGPITLEILPEYFKMDIPKNSMSIDIELNEDVFLQELVDEYERRIIQQSYEKNKYNVLKTAKSLGIPRQTLYYKLNKYNIK